jgi:dihydroorotase
MFLHAAKQVRFVPKADIALPLRPISDVAALRRELTGGALDVIATDHAPHHPDEKAASATDIWKAPGGFPGVQTFLPVMLKLVADGAINYPTLVRLCCAAPARRFGLYPCKGALQIGSDADVVIVDPDQPMIVQNARQISKARNVPFDGLLVPATPLLACLRGQVIMRDGHPVGLALGEFIRLSN